MKNAAAEATPRLNTTPFYPLDVRSQLAGILAGMILGQQLEITR